MIPRDKLLGDPQYMSPQISPDGGMLAYYAPYDGVMNLWAGPVGADDFKPVTQETGRGIPMPSAVTPEYCWANDNRHLLFWMDNDGDENWRLHAVDVFTKDVRVLTPNPKAQARLLALAPSMPTAALIGLNDRDPKWHDVYLIDIESGELTKVLENPGYGGWIPDRQLRPRGAMRMRDDAGIDIDVRDDDGTWRTLLRLDMIDAMSTRGSGAFSADGKTLYLVTSVDDDTSQLLAIDVATGKRTHIAGDPDNDVTGVRSDPVTGEPLLVTVYADRLKTIPLDEAWGAGLERLGAQLDGDIAVTSRDLGGTYWTVSAVSDVSPPKYYLYDRTTGELTHLFDSRPELAGEVFCPTEPFSFEARDGLTVHGYLTFPKDGRENLPAVLTVHGGPWARDMWAFQPFVQLLADRGYLVVQVNYRASTGYGKAHVRAGAKQWAEKMHDDLIDAVEYVIAQGYADRDRIGITGGSYGGFATLVGATFTPEYFACAAEVCGPSNLISLIRSFPSYWGPNLRLWHKHVGDPDTEESFLWSRSPLSKVDNISKPLLVIQTENDPRVTAAEAEQIVAACKEKGIPHEYVLVPNEGHGFVRPESRILVYGAIERFLAPHLGGRAED